MYTAVFLALFASVALCDPSRHEIFDLFLKKYNKAYTGSEYEERRAIFMSNYEYIRQNSGKNGVHLAVNAHTDMLSHEIKKSSAVHSEPLASEMEMMEKRNGALPTSFDWRQKGGVGPVHNQGQIGAEIFPLVDSIATCSFKVTGKLPDLSFAQLVDCTPGSQPGLLDPYWKYVLSAPGIDSTSCYPNTVGQCRFDRSCCITSVKSALHVQKGNETALQYAVFENPVPVAIDASHASFEMYSSGIYYEPACSSTILDHEVLVVGWGSTGGRDYWIIKNSWGPSWGMSGYAFMSRNRNNNCGIATFASFPRGCGPCH